MSGTQIALLGAIAGFTIFLGLPIGRVRARLPRLKATLNAIAIGILLFLLFDVLEHAWEPIDAAAADRHAGPALGYGLILTAGVALGLVGLIYFDRWVAARTAASTAAGDAPAEGWRSAAGQLALLIATGIGLHNFAEGLAIGNSAAAGEIALAVLLVIGFGLHNATEGFGIVAPLSAADIRPSWGFLAVLGLIGGGPTFVGTIIGQQFTSEPLSIAFLALAAGSILYVIIELLAVGRKLGFKQATGWGIMTGLVLGFATDAVLIVAGA
jgi:ZIP family zinc transporter